MTTLASPQSPIVTRRHTTERPQHGGRKRTVLLLSLVTILLTGFARAGELPATKLGRPLRVHIARGLWWQMLRLHEALGLLGGADLSNSVDVYGSPTGYHGCARAMGTFPHKPEQLAEQDIIVLAGSRVAALPARTQTALIAWVKAGGGLLITGGPLSLDCDKFGPLADILPVRMTKDLDLARLEKTILKPASDGPLATLDWSASPRAYWYHERVAPREGSTVLLTAGKTPLLMMSAVGKGKVAVFSGTVCGNPAKDETAFWDWPDWPQALSIILQELAPASARTMPAAKQDKKKVAAAMERLAELSDSGLDGLIDEELGEDDAADGKSVGGTGEELVRLSALTQTPEFAESIAKAAAGSNARLSLAGASTIFQAIEKHVPAEAAAEASAELLKSTSPGGVALGLRLGGLARAKVLGPDMVRFVAKGLGAIAAEEEEGGIAGGSPGVPDGKDEGLRLAAAQALADLADPGLVPALRKANQQWLGERSQVPSLADAQRDVEETIMAGLAVMEDADAAVWMVNRLLDNALAREMAVDISEHRSRNPSPQDVLQRKKALISAVWLRHRNDRLRHVLRQLPRITWKGLAARTKGWNGEFATEALLLILAVREDVVLSAKDRTTLTTIQGQSPIPAIQNLCKVRLAQN